MYETNLRIEFISDWHIGSGLGNGAVADAILNRDIHGIPCIPGSAVKGALREGAWRLGLCSEELNKLPELIFGSESDTGVSNRPGLITVGQAKLDNDLVDWLLNQGEFKEFIEDMTVIRQQTKLDSQKMVVPGSLRSIECGIAGLVFSTYVTVDIPGDTYDLFRHYFGAVCACVKSIGADRARGLGRCRFLPHGGHVTTMPGALPQSLKTLARPGGQK